MCLFIHQLIWREYFDPVINGGHVEVNFLPEITFSMKRSMKIKYRSETLPVWRSGLVV